MIFIIVILSAILILLLSLARGKGSLQYLFYFWVFCFNVGPSGEKIFGIQVFYIEGITWLIFLMFFVRFNGFAGFRKVFPKYTILLFISTIIAIFTALYYGRNFIGIIDEAKVFFSIIPVFYLTYAGFKYLNIRFNKIMNIFAIGALALTMAGVLFYFFPSLTKILPATQGGVFIGTEEHEVIYQASTYRRGGGSFWAVELVSAYLLLLFFPLYVQKGFFKQKMKKNLYLLLCILIAVTAVINGQRSVWLGFLLGWAFFSLMRGFKGIFVGVLVFFIVVNTLPLEFFSRFSSVFSPSDEAWAGRVSRYANAKNIMLEHPFLGIGWGGSGWVHNFILQLGANLGIIGLFFFLLWLGKLFLGSMAGYKKFINEKYLRMYLVAFLTSSIAFLLPLAGESVINQPFLMLPFWFFCAVLHNFSNGNISDEWGSV